MTNTHASDAVWGRGAVYALLRLFEMLLEEEEGEDRGGAGPRRRHGHLVGPVARLLGLTCTAGVSVKELRRILTLISRRDGVGTPDDDEDDDDDVAARRHPPPPPPARVPTLPRLHLIRALTTAAEGSARSTRLLGKASPPCFFTFGRGPGLVRTVKYGRGGGGAPTATTTGTTGGTGGGGRGVAGWPFKHDFGMACWFRAERFDRGASEGYGRNPTLLSVRSEDRGGIEVALQVCPSGDDDDDDDGGGGGSGGGGRRGGSAAASLVVTVFDSSTSTAAAGGGGTTLSPSELPQSVRLTGCVLSPRVWYHVAVRHTRPRLKGYFSLPTLRDEISVTLDGKVMLTEHLRFPRVVDGGGGGGGGGKDGGDVGGGSARGIGGGARGIGGGGGGPNGGLGAGGGGPGGFTVRYGSDFDGQAGSLYLFNDAVSDGTVRALFEATAGTAADGGGGGGGVGAPRSAAESAFSDQGWDAHRGEMARRANAVSTEMMKVDAEEIVVTRHHHHHHHHHHHRGNQRGSGVGGGGGAGGGVGVGVGGGPPGSRSGSAASAMASSAAAAVLDLADDESNPSHASDASHPPVPPELARAAFGSKLFLVWDPSRTSGTVALDVHSNVHPTIDAGKIQPWYVDGARDVIRSLGGVQALLPLFRSLLTTEDGEEEEADRRGRDDSGGRDGGGGGGRGEEEATCCLIPDLIRLLTSFLRDHSDNAREMLRCGGVDVVEQCLLKNKLEGDKWLASAPVARRGGSGPSKDAAFLPPRSSAGRDGKPRSMTDMIRLSPSLSEELVEALLDLRLACAQSLALEAKVFSRLLFNLPLWLGGSSRTAGVALHASLLPVLSAMAKGSPNKVRECVGVKDMMECVKELTIVGNSAEEVSQLTKEPKTCLFDRSSKSNLPPHAPLTIHERRHTVDVLLGIVVTVLAPNSTALHISPLLNFMSHNLDNEWEMASIESQSASNAMMRTGSREERYIATSKACSVLLFLLQSRPTIPNLYESLEEYFGSSNNVASWILCAMVNSFDDFVRSLGVRCLTAVLDANAASSAGGGAAPNSPAMMADPSDSSAHSSVSDTVKVDPPATPPGQMTVAKGTVTTITKTMKIVGTGLGVIGTSTGLSNILVSSRLNTKVVYKLLWHLLKCHRDRLGDFSHAALVHLLVDDGNNPASIKLSYLKDGIVIQDNSLPGGYKLNTEWAILPLTEVGLDTSQSLRDTYAVSTILRTLRFLPLEMKERWLFDLLALVRMSPPSVRALLPCRDWQPCLFHVLSEIVEEIGARRATGGGGDSTEGRGAEARTETRETSGGVVAVAAAEADRDGASGDARTDGATVRRLPRSGGVDYAGRSPSGDVNEEDGERREAGAEEIPREERRLLQEKRVSLQKSLTQRHLMSKSPVRTRYDLTLKLYSTLLGHSVRQGGDKAFQALEQAASLQRVCVNGHEVFSILLSHLLAELIDNGTVTNLDAMSEPDAGTPDERNRALKQSARIVTNAILTNGADGMDMASAVRQWRCLRHLTAVTVAVVTKSGFGVADLFDYRNQNASSIDDPTGGLHGIRLPDTGVAGIASSDAVLTGVVGPGGSHNASNHDERRKHERDTYRRICVTLSSQLLSLLDAFIFPDSLDASLPASQLHGLALVRSTEPRLGQTQGPLLASLLRLSLVLLSHLEPSSVKFLQCCSRLRCFLHWTLELIRESVALGGYSAAFHDLTAPLDRLVLAVVLQCHRAFSRCSAVLIEIESNPYDKYFPSEDVRKKNYKRLFRGGLELREIVLAAYRGRNEVLRAALSLQAYEALQTGLEEITSAQKHKGRRGQGGGGHVRHGSSSGTVSSKEASLRSFMANSWVTGFHDVEMVSDKLAIPEQVANGQVYRHRTASNRGRLAIEELAAESKAMVDEYNRALNVPFETYCEDQRKWAETDAVRDLEYEGDLTVKRLSSKHRADLNETSRLLTLRSGAATHRYKAIERKVTEPWTPGVHWKLAKHTDRLHRRILLVRNRHFEDHSDASYELMLGKEREKAMKEREERLKKKKEQEVNDMLRRASEGVVPYEEPCPDEADAELEEETKLEETKLEDRTARMVKQASEGILKIDKVDEDDEEDRDEDEDDDVTLEPEQSVDGISSQQYAVPCDLSVSAIGHDWDQIEAEDIQHDSETSNSDANAWAKAFIWSDGEYAVCLFPSVVLVTLQTTTEGQLLLTTHGLYFHPTGHEINVMTKEQVTPSDADRKDGAERSDRRWRLSRLTEVHGRRYLLRAQALELFFADTHELFINFSGGTKDRDKFYSKLRSSCKVPMLCSPKSLNPRTVFKRSKLTELWQKRKISNFQYLMQLNIMAGRTFNDITQYPVFPWVLSDYTSATLDLKDTRVFRDLSKPVGALNPDRLAQLIERYHDLDGFPEEEKFLYGSHYSSPGVILHYLIRQEPFTTMAIELQSGRFDCPDRLFFDVAGCWKSCLTSTSDVKELTPEFFTCPEIFLNTNSFPLGETQMKRPVDNVGLPPWANGSAYEFVRLNRLALESEYVTRNLHHWVDLIFGYKQRGPEAAAAHNVFHYLSYEGSVDLDKITNELDRKATESHIQNFGQTPSQLIVKEPHPMSYTADVCWKPLCIDANRLKELRCYTPSKQFGGNHHSSENHGSVLSVQVLTDTVLVVYADMSVGTYKWSPTRNGAVPFVFKMEKIRTLGCRNTSMSYAAVRGGLPSSSGDTTLSSHDGCIQSGRLEVGNWSFGMTLGGLYTDNLRRRTPVGSGRGIEGHAAATHTEATAHLLSCGYWDDTIKVHSVDGLRLKCSESGGHHGPINCLSVGEDGALMITGGSDATCRVWVVDHPDMSTALSDGYVQTALGSLGYGTKEKVLSCCHVLWGHEAAVSCLALSSDLDVAISGSVDGVICVHNIRRGKFVRSIHVGISTDNSKQDGSANDCDAAPAIRTLALDTNGNFVAHLENGMLLMYTVNGVQLCATDAREKLHAMKICPGGEMLVTGGERCHVVLRTLHDLAVRCVLDLSHHGPIQCVSFTPPDLNPVPQFMFIGTSDGKVTIVDRDPKHDNNSLLNDGTTAKLWHVHDGTAQDQQGGKAWWSDVTVQEEQGGSHQRSRGSDKSNGFAER